MVLEKEIESISATIDHYKKQNDTVSKSGVDWHIDHILKVILVVSERLKDSDPKKYKWKFNFLRMLIFTVGRFPRGKAKAPKISSINENEEITKNQLLDQLKLVKKELLEIECLPKNNHFKHHIFGVLNLKQTHKFLRLHTQHHLKITNEIINKKLKS